jgi:adenylate kinase family enzyme
MKKVVILGSPGSGKSTFATKLHAKTGIPIVHLDFYYHQRAYNYYNDREAWVAKVQELMQPAAWLMDGNYKSTIPMRCDAADTIILFRLPSWLCLLRALKRRVVYHNKKRADMPSEWKEKADWQFLKYVWTFNTQQMPLITETLAQNSSKEIHIFRTSKEADRFLEQLDANQRQT